MIYFIKKYSVIFMICAAMSCALDVDFSGPVFETQRNPVQQSEMIITIAQTLKKTREHAGDIDFVMGDIDTALRQFLSQGTVLTVSQIQTVLQSAMQSVYAVPGFSQKELDVQRARIMSDVKDLTDSTRNITKLKELITFGSYSVVGYKKVISVFLQGVQPITLFGLEKMSFDLYNQARLYGLGLRGCQTAYSGSVCPGMKKDTELSKADAVKACSSAFSIGLFDASLVYPFIADNFKCPLLKALYPFTLELNQKALQGCFQQIRSSLQKIHLLFQVQPEIKDMTVFTATPNRGVQPNIRTLMHELSLLCKNMGDLPERLEYAAGLYKSVGK